MIPVFAHLRLRIIASLAALTLSAPIALSDVSTWNNGDGGNWSVGGNWLGGAAPAPGATTTLIFGSPEIAAKSYTATNDIGGAAFDLTGLSFTGSAGTLVTLKGLDNAVNALNFTGLAPTIIIGAGDGTIAMATQLAASTTLTGAGGTLTFGNSVTAPAAGITLTKSSTGSLVLGGGGSFGTLSVQAGAASATGGTLALTAPTGMAGTDPNGASGLQLGAAAGQTASFTASGGATVNVTENIYVGDATGSTGTLTVTGAGTVLSNTGGTSGRLGVGNNGAGTLNVTNGAVLNTERLFSSRQAGSSSTVLVDGAGSTLHVVTQAAFGSNAPGTVTVQNGGSIVADRLFNLGNNAPGNGLLTVTGTGSSLTAINPAIGALGTGTLTVKDGATATFTAHIAAGVSNIGLSVAAGANTTGTVNIQSGGVVTVGGDSTTEGDGQIVIGEGANSTATLNIQGGGALNLTGALFAGAVGGSTGTVTVTGANSSLTATTLIMGGGDTPGGRGDLNVTAGATVTVQNVSFAQNTGASSTSMVDAATLTIADQLVIGLEGDATLTIKNGGTTTVGGNAFVGTDPGVTGAVTVTGSGSSLVVADQLQLGGSGDTPGGTAPLTVSAGATASAGGLLVLFGGGSVDINGGVVNAGALLDGVENTSAGTIKIGGVGGALNILGNADGGFSGVISGTGGITKSGDKFQILGGDNTYQGGTTVNAGALVVAHPHALGTGGLTINGTGEVVLDTGLPAAVRLASLTMAGGASPTGTLDVDNNKLIVTGGDVGTFSGGKFTGIAGLIQSGYNGGTWDGPGIITTSGATTPSAALGYARAGDVDLAGGTFGGEPVTATDVLVMYTLAGDANLDGTVGFNDLVRLAQNYNGTGKFWWQGDFTYDGNVDFSDLVKLAQNYGGALPGEGVPGASLSFNTDLAAALASVPEPSGFGVLGLITFGAAARRSRRSSTAR
jgi:fibronectin-binding autotransporter adhesin